MDLISILKQIPMPVLLLAIIIVGIVTIWMALQYVKWKGFEGIRNNVYQLILQAEHTYKESSQGKQKLKWVVSQARKLLPVWMQLFVSEEALKTIIDGWFKGIKDLLDDGKMNGTS